MNIKVDKKNIGMILINFFLLALLCLPSYEKGAKHYLSIVIAFSVLTNLFLYFNKVYDFFHKYRYIILTIIFAVLVVFKIHGSSIGIWNQYINDRVKNTNDILMGEPRMIRSDEWLVQTPLYLSQYSDNVKFGKINENIRSEGEDILISDYSPAKDISNIGKPFNWGFLFLDQERGLSWYWFSKLIILFLLSYELFVFLLDGKKKISFFAATYLTLSPPIQWWFSTTVVDLIILGQGIIVSFIYFVKVKGIAKKILNTLLISIFSIGFILALYPAIQVPLGYIILIFIAYMLFENYKELNKKDFIYVTAAILIIGSVVGLSLLNSLDAIKGMMSTVYPGKRVATGGEYLFESLNFYIANPLLPYKQTNFLNSSELSRFITIIPIILLTPYIIYKREVKNKGLVYALYGFFVFQLSWLFIKYPAIVGKVTLFSYVPEFRTVLVLGLTGVYLTAILLNALIKDPLSKIESSIITLIVIVNVVYVGWESALNQYISLNELVVITLVFALLSYSILRGLKKLSLAILMVITLVSGAMVNPIAQGLGPLKDKVVFNKIKEINTKAPGAWVSLENHLFGNFLIASGVKTVNGVHYYPDLNLWHKLDTDSQYEDIYNRYSHVQVSIVSENTSFELVGQDSFMVKVNYNDFYKLNAKYIFTRSSLEEFNSSKKIFEEIYYNDVDKIRIYKFIG
ncbi:MAG: hypothetical protein AB6733_22615 [Clostridiaceae bacterium]